MQALPIHHLRREDAIVFGTDYIPLAKIARITKSVPKGLLISPPLDEIFSAMVKHRTTNLATFERNKGYIKETLLKIEFSHHILTEFAKENLIISQIWPSLVDKWLDQLHSYLNRFDSVSKKDLVLNTQAVFSLDESAIFGSAFIDPLRDHVVIKDDRDALGFEAQAELDRLVRISNSNLLIPHVYTYAFSGGKVFIIKAQPYTHTDLTKTSKITNLSLNQESLPQKKRALKLFMNLKDNFTLWEHADGIVINSAHFNDAERKLHALTESCISLAAKPVFYKFSIHPASKLRDEAEIIKFVKNKKSLHNLQICLTGVKNTQSLLEAKRELATLGVTRKGSLLFRVEFTTPESLINIASYIDVGFDGVVINTDTLLQNLFGMSQEELNQVQSEKRALTLCEFLKEPLKKLHRAELPVLLSGENAVIDEVIDFAIAHGLWGIELEEMKEYLNDQLSMKEFLNLRFG